MNAQYSPNERYRPHVKYAQGGATLITALVMLVVLTLLVLSAINSSTTNLQIAGNMQIQEEVLAAAQQGTEQILSSNFTVNPVSATIPIDINNDGVSDYTANIAAPTCSGDTPLTNNTPNLPAQCLSSGVSQNTGIIFSSGVVLAGTSWCDAQQWDVDTQVSDTRTGSGEIIHQGISTIVAAGTTCTVSLPNSP